MAHTPKKKCLYDGCANPLLAKGYCCRHYWQIKRTGRLCDLPSGSSSMSKAQLITRHKVYRIENTKLKNNLEKCERKLANLVKAFELLENDKIKELESTISRLVSEKVKRCQQSQG